MTARKLPDAWDLPRPRYSGWACVWCGASLERGGRSAGIAHSARGEYYSVEVYECFGRRACDKRRQQQTT